MLWGQRDRLSNCIYSPQVRTLTWSIRSFLRPRPYYIWYSSASMHAVSLLIGTSTVESNRSRVHIGARLVVIQSLHLTSIPRYEDASQPVLLPVDPSMSSSFDPKALPPVDRGKPTSLIAYKPLKQT